MVETTCVAWFALTGTAWDDMVSRVTPAGRMIERSLHTERFRLSLACASEHPTLVCAVKLELEWVEMR